MSSSRASSSSSWLPATVIDFRLDAVLDDESPAFFLCAAGLTLEPANELGKFVS